LLFPVHILRACFHIAASHGLGHGGDARKGRAEYHFNAGHSGGGLLNGFGQFCAFGGGFVHFPVSCHNRRAHGCSSCDAVI